MIDKRHYGFTMIELIFVIVILGIVASMGSGIIAKIYQSYIYSRSINNLQSKSETALLQIAKYLSFRIKDSVVARKMPPNDTNISSLSTIDGDYEILEWIGYDNESFKGNKGRPGWSAFVDLVNPKTNKSQLFTPGGDLLYAKKIIYALSSTKVDLSSKDSSAAIIFTEMPNQFEVKKYGWNDYTGDIHHEYIHRVQNIGTNILKFVENNVSTIYEHYKLVWSAYALVPEGNSNDKNLTFYYNYRPWMGERYSDGYRSTLIEHVHTFRFRQSGTTIRLKLCIFDPIAKDINISFCKEKVVF